MTSTARTTPDIDPASRVDPPGRAGETETLLAYLRYHRDTFRWKTGGLTKSQLAVRLPPSDMALGGMIKHLALVEVGWFHEFFGGGDQVEPWASVDWDSDPDWEWRTALDDSPAQLSEIYERCVEMADAAIAQASPRQHRRMISVRTATVGDWPSIWPIVQEVVGAGETYALPADLAEGVAREMWVEAPPGRTVVAVDRGGVVLGSAHMGPNRPGPGDHIGTASFMVGSAARGHGVGRARRPARDVSEAVAHVAWRGRSSGRGNVAEQP